MKRLLFIFIITFSFQSFTKADDIRDFEIEGMSIGDSALDFMSIDEIKKTIKLSANNYDYLKSPRKYREAYIFEANDFKNYQKVSLMFKQNDKDYKILFIGGLIDYNENLSGCLSKLDEIAKDIEEFIPSNTKEFVKSKSPLDKSGNSIYHNTYYTLASGDEIILTCNDWDEKLRKKNNWSEGLSVILQSKEITLWFRNRK
jgi:hypothetical protein